MIEEHIKNAVKQACEQHGQSEEVAEMLNTWLNEVALGNEEVCDENAYKNRLNIILPILNVDAEKQ